MKQVLFYTICVIMLASSCKKSGTTASAELFMTYTAGSKWNYQQINNTAPASTNLYTITSTSRDSTIDGTSYHVFTNSSTGGSEYYSNSAGNYYTYQQLAAALGGTKVVSLYLKDNVDVNTSWSQTYNIVYSGLPLAVTTTNTVKEKGITKTVSGTTYNNVIHIQTSIAVAGIPPSALTTDVHNYYAPKVGHIQGENKLTLNYLGVMNSTDITTNLLSSTLQ